jgi:hypothetical protein
MPDSATSATDDAVPKSKKRKPVEPILNAEILPETVAAISTKRGRGKVTPALTPVSEVPSAVKDYPQQLTSSRQQKAAEHPDVDIVISKSRSKAGTKTKQATMSSPKLAIKKKASVSVSPRTTRSRPRTS